MPTIAYLGPAFAGKRRSLTSLATELHGELHATPPIVELRANAVVARTVTGLVFEDATRVEILRAADAVVFVADARASRQDQTLEMWENLADYLERAGRPANMPVVLQWSNVEAADARSIEDVEHSLGLQAFIVGGELRMPNPYALRFPARFTSAREAFDAAARAAVHGPFEIPPDAADFAKAMLDQQLATRLASAMPGIDRDTARRAVRGDEGARAELEGSMRDDFMAMLLDRFESDPAFQQMILDEVGERLECTVLAPDLKCPSCKEPLTSLEISGATGGPFSVGDRVDIDLDRLSPDLDWVMHRPEGSEVVWLTGGECDRCDGLVWCSLTFQDGVLASVWPAAFTRTTYQRAHVVSCGGMQLEAARLLGVAPETLTTRAAVTAALERL